MLAVPLNQVIDLPGKYEIKGKNYSTILNFANFINNCF